MMARSGRTSAGLLLFRRSPGGPQFFLAHPGGPFWKKRDDGAWTIPKGEPSTGEDPFAAAIREFEEETGIRPRGPFIDLGSVRQKGGKTVRAWAWEGEADPDAIVSNDVSREWPPRSGRYIVYPEVDRCGWFDYAESARLINPAQVALLDRLLEHLDSSDEPPAT